MAGNLPALLLTAAWAVLTAVVYYILMKWTGPTVVWTIAPGVARGVRDWVSGAQRGRPSSSSRGAEAAETPATLSGDQAAEIVEL